MEKMDFRTQAFEIARAQAGVRPMTATEVASYVAEVTQALESAIQDTPAKPVIDPRNSIGESYVTCLSAARSSRL